MSYNLLNYNLDERLILEREIIAYILTFDQNLRMKNEFLKHGIDDSKYFFSTIYGYMFEAAKAAWNENIETDVLSIIKQQIYSKIIIIKLLKPVCIFVH